MNKYIVDTNLDTSDYFIAINEMPTIQNINLPMSQNR